MTPNAERYVIRGGKAGYDRLQLLARDRWPDTSALFRRAGVSPGMRCVDLGCGGGAVSFELARLVVPGGTVTGFDMDEEKLRLARAAASERQLQNVEFRTINVNDWSEPNAYDVAYSRFLLQHLREPMGLIRRMWAAVRPGGALLLEDADFEGWGCDPPNEGFDFFVRTYCLALRYHGGDPAAARKLYRYCLDAGIPDPQVNAVQPVRIRGEAKTLPWSTLDGSADAILAAGVATSSEITSALADLATFTENPHTLISGPRIFQVWARRGK